MNAKIKKVVKLFLIGVPLLLIVLFLILFLNLNKIVKSGVETAGPKVLQAPVTVETVKLSPLSGNGEITNLVIGNPEGFKTDGAFKLNRIKIDLQLSSLKSDTIIINEIIIDAPEITYEMTSLKQSNIKQILANVEEFTGGPSEDESEEKPEKEKPGKKVVIKKFELNGARARIGLTTLGDHTVAATLPDIHLENIGEENDGATGAEVLGHVLGKVLASLTDITGSAIDALKSGEALVEDALKAGSEAAQDALKTGGEAAQDAIKAGGEAAAKGAEKLKGATSDAVGGLKGLLGKDKDEK